MLDPRMTKLAETLVNFSTNVQPGENVHIDVTEIDMALVKEVVKAVHKAGGNPFVTVRHNEVQRQLLMNATEEQLRVWGESEAAHLDKMDCWIGIRGGNNISQLSDVPAEKMDLYNKVYRSQTGPKIMGCRWVTLRYPTDAFAQSANMSTEAFEEFYFNVCTLDYAKMSKAMDALKELMDRTDKVRLVGPGTDLSFSMAGIPSVKCDGHVNIPDGEVYSAPVRDSVNGVISFNAATNYQGFTFENVRFVFEDGKIVEATSNDNERINKILDSDEGARYIGEFSIAFNPFIKHPMLDTLFDEKIDGSFHFTPGQCYDNAFNGNKSVIHWDIVNIQRPEYGGGEIWFDGVLIRKDGRFVVPELEALNPENLV
ncbi:aminopeptidase [Tumebacillus avium]|uniref:Aminopeptidase n=1 Tax=Tumebacillus avium TaxID=1903704 RepID=A0A1Y0IX11_9BACL|nr:aminopeptidase [Tumebacillus avium]ARU63883.1 aminopeptidase [Tumebacillus avium]